MSKPDSGSRHGEEQNAEDWVRRFSEASLDGVAVLVDGRFVEVNAALEQMTGYGREELVGAPPERVIAPDHAEEALRRIAAEDESVYSSVLQRRDGTRVEVQVRGVRVEMAGVKARLTVVRDLTELRRVAHELSSSERRWRALLEQASDGIFVADPKLRLVEANEAACEMLGYSREELLEMTVPDLGDPDEIAARPLDVDAMRRGEIARTERTMIRKDGTRLDTAISARFLPDLGVFHAIARDVSAYNRARERLARSEARFRTVTEHLPQAVAVLREGRLVYVNPSCVRLLGARRVKELIGRSPLELVHPDERDAAAERIEGAAEGGGAFAVDRRVITLDGRALLTREVVLPIVYDDAPALMMILQDVTEQARLEAQLRRAQRMEAVGRLAGGIAHDFNNMLSVILSYAELARAQVAAVPTALDQITEAAERSAAMARQLLSFSRHQVVEAEIVDPTDVVQRTARLLRRTLGEHVRMRCVSDGGAYRVFIPPSQLEQVVINLALNARDAMRDGGDLVIETGGAAATDAFELVVKDDGCGMSSEVVEHAFDPFYSTKPPGEGSGLGLSVVYGIVTRNGGDVELDSSPRAGTAVTVRLPTVEAEAEPTARESARRRGPSGRGEHVVVVEDEPAVRALLVRMLEADGYRPITATPREAIERAKSEAPFELLLTDVVMPEMNGGELARAVTQIRPDVPVLYMSGYADDSVEGLVSHHGFVAKPFTMEKLMTAVRSALEDEP